MSIAEKFETIADAVYGKGKANESIAWIDAITNHGKRTQYSNVGIFGYTDFSNFEFAKPLVIKGNPDSLFRAYRGAKLPRQQDIDLREATTVYRTFSYITKDYGAAKYIPDYGIPAVDEYNQTYDNSTAIETIEIIRCYENTTFTSNAFTNCVNLKNVTFEGIIGKSINLSWSPLSVESMKNIIEHLMDYAGTEKEFKYSVTFSSACLTMLENLDPTTDPSPNGNSWIQYLDDIGWTNL